MSAFPERLDDGRVALRRVVEADAPAFAGAFRDDPDLWVRLGIPQPWTEETVLAGLEHEERTRAAGTQARWAIAPMPDELFAGALAFRDVDRINLRAELGIWLVPAARGTGAGRRAIALAERIAFGRLGLNRLYLHTERTNDAMRALAARAGWREEGVLREHDRERDGSFSDLVIASRLAREAA